MAAGDEAHRRFYELRDQTVELGLERDAMHAAGFGDEALAQSEERLAQTQDRLLNHVIERGGDMRAHYEEQSREILDLRQTIADVAVERTELFEAQQLLADEREQHRHELQELKDQLDVVQGQVRGLSADLAVAYEVDSSLSDYEQVLRAIERGESDRGRDGKERE